MNITPHLFEAFLKCPTKCWLRSTGEPSAGNPYAEWVQAQNESYRAVVSKQLIANAPADECAVLPGSSRRQEAPYSAENLKAAKWCMASDVPVRIEFRSSRGQEAQPSTINYQQSLLTSAATIIESCLHAVERAPSEGRGKPAQFVPIRFIFRNKLTKDDRLLLAFDAFVLSETLSREVRLGKIIHGDEPDCGRSSRGNEAQTSPSENSQSLLTSAATHNGVEEPQTAISAALCPAQPRVTKVKTSALAGEVRKRLDKITALLANPTPPDLVLNRHCAECEFRDRCRRKAIETDDLSLLAGMSAKERQKLRSKGIFTVTQLSYTFRPRRRPKRLRDKRERYHHSLKALAIREKKIHIVGSPELKIEGTPVYLDVEGLPDRDFYYLIGVRIGHGDSAVQHSLWADTIADEEKIWREFLAILETVEKPVLIHYGSYETDFLKKMKEHHGSPQIESNAAKVMDAAVNLVSVLFAQIHFPVFSNGLKEVAAILGHIWSAGIPSGLDSIVWRFRWEQSSDEDQKRHLLAYNAQDCKALSLVSDTIRRFMVRAAEDNEPGKPSVVHADADEFAKRSKWRTFVSPVSGFEYINTAAHWGYQRHRVYARSGGVKLKPKKRLPRKRFFSRVEQVVMWERSCICPKCNRRFCLKCAAHSRTLQDILFGRHSLKRRLVRYVFQSYRCRRCGNTFGLPERFRLCRKYGWNLVAYFFYQVVDLCIPQLIVVKSFNRTFGFELSRSTLSEMKIRVAKYYTVTKEQILERIIRGSLVHADETRANIKGKSAFVWVLTSFREVVYILSDSREGEIVQKLLAGFKGVLVSDFYTAYDSINCPQQKCLIHLMRDLNDEILSNPFDEQLKQVVTAFGDLLKPTVETVDRYGLKKHYLRKHLKSVGRFYRELGQAEYQSEAALKLKERFERNRDTLFTFLSHDGVPWNNNNAEHAVKAFAGLRDVIAGSSTEQGVEQYLTLLSVCQTCKYMGVDFLDFLRSGEKDIHAFAESRRRRRRQTQPSQPPNLPAIVIPDSGGQP